MGKSKNDRSDAKIFDFIFKTKELIIILKFIFSEIKICMKSEKEKKRFVIR